MHRQLQVTAYVILPPTLSHALQGVVEFVECHYILQDLHLQIIVMSQQLQWSSCHVLAVIVQHVNGASLNESLLAPRHIMHITSALFGTNQC